MRAGRRCNPFNRPFPAGRVPGPRFPRQANPTAVTQAGEGRHHVAKRQRVSVLQVLLGNRRLRVAEGLAEARTLQRELETFQVKLTAAGNEQFESWRDRDHDDLVLAVALAAWSAESLSWPYK